MPSVSKKQQKFMGIVRAIQKGEADPSDFNKDAQDAAKKMKKSSVRKYAKTKHDDLPTKKEGVQRDRNNLALQIIDLNNRHKRSYTEMSSQALNIFSETVDNLSNSNKTYLNQLFR